MSKEMIAIGKMYATTNYDMFKTIVGNRPVIPKGAHYKEVMDSIAKEGQIVPAVVNDRNEIIDGQHRLHICKELGIPFVYIVSDGRGFADIAKANAGRKWKTESFVYGYALNGGANADSYRYLKALYDEFNPPIMKSVFTRIQSRHNPEVARQIREGNFKMSAHEYELISKCLRELIAYGYADFIKENNRPSNVYWAALCYTWRHPMVDNARLIKLMWQNEKRVSASNKIKEVLESLSIIYNKKLSVQKKVYLDKDYEQKLYREW